MFFSPDLNFYNKNILRELKDLFIISRHNHINIHYVDDMLMATSEEKLKELLDKIADDKKNKRLTINYKKIECIIVRKKVQLKMRVLYLKCKY